MITLGVLFSCDAIRKNILYHRMVQYNLASAREDGTPNRVVLIGEPGFVGKSRVYLKYLEDGLIILSGDNLQEDFGWKYLSSFELEPGTYTLTGMTDVPESVIAIQLRISEEAGFYRYIYQYDENVTFTIDRLSEATLHIMVYPEVEGIDIVARPAVYRDD